MNWLMSWLDTERKICKLENSFKELAKCGHKALEDMKEREVLRDMEDRVKCFNIFWIDFQKEAKRKHRGHSFGNKY